MATAARELSVSAMETRVAPYAFRHAQTARGMGLGVTRALAMVSGLLLAVVVVAINVAIGLGGWDAARFLPGLVAVAALGAYAAASPTVFDRISRAATAPQSTRWLGLLVLGHAAGWVLVLLAVRG
jgi:hypothetical protein